MLRRSPLVLWTAALLLSALPFAWYSLFASDTAGTATMLGFFGTPADCPGYQSQLALGGYTEWAADLPAPLVVAAAFALWGLLTAKGLPRAGRAAGWLGLIVVNLPSLVAYGPAGLDAVLSERCGILWESWLDGEWATIAWRLNDLIIAVLILMAVRVPRHGPPRRSALSRTAAAFVTLALLLLTARTDTVPGTVTYADAEVCRPWAVPPDPGHPLPVGDRETAFVCAARQRYALPERFARTPDEELIALGRTLCTIAIRGDRREAAAMRERTGVDAENDGTVELLRSLCPDLDAKITAQERADEAAYQARAAALDRQCARARHRPLARPAGVARRRLEAGDGVLESLEAARGAVTAPAGGALLRAARRDGLVATASGHVVIVNDSGQGVCVTAETYRHRPPVEVRGWDEVVEAGYRSPAGDLRLADATGQSTLPDLAFLGRGRYRIRVHHRAARPGGQQVLLIEVFPGRAARTVVYRRGHAVTR